MTGDHKLILFTSMNNSFSPDAICHCKQKNPRGRVDLVMSKLKHHTRPHHATLVGYSEGLQTWRFVLNYGQY